MKRSTPNVQRPTPAELRHLRKRANYTDRVKHVVEAGDIEEAMRAAAAVGDDRLQYRSRGYVVPDSFTHGTSEQHVRWFRRGYETGDLSQGDTFNAPKL